MEYLAGKVGGKDKLKGIGRRTRGFTLLEVSIVTLLMGLLIAIALPAFNQARTNSRAAAVISDLREIDGAKTQYVMKNNLGPGDPVNDGTALAPTYLKTWPTGPVTGTYSANPVNTNPSFLGQDYLWYTTHCQGVTADASCPL